MFLLVVLLILSIICEREVLYGFNGVDDTLSIYTYSLGSSDIDCFYTFDTFLLANSESYSAVALDDYLVVYVKDEDFQHYVYVFNRTDAVGWFNLETGEDCHSIAKYDEESVICVQDKDSNDDQLELVRIFVHEKRTEEYGKITLTEPDCTLLYYYASFYVTKNGGFDKDRIFAECYSGDPYLYRKNFDGSEKTISLGVYELITKSIFFNDSHYFVTRNPQEEGFTRELSLFDPDKLTFRTHIDTGSMFPKLVPSPGCFATICSKSNKYFEVLYDEKFLAYYYQYDVYSKSFEKSIKIPIKDDALDNLVCY